MNFLFTCDDHYAGILGVALVSLFENNKEALEINLYILEDQISQENKEKIRQVTKKYGRSCTFLPAPDIQKLVDIPLTFQRWALSAFSRLFLTDSLPAEMERILYLDCDILVTGSLKEIWETNIDGCLIAAVADCISDEHKATIGLKPQDIYVNNGVILFNLKEWRAKKMPQRCIQFIRKWNGKVPYADQGTLNGCVDQKIVLLPPKDNAVSVFFDFSYRNLLKYRKPSRYYKEEEIEQAVRHPVIVHFTSSFLSRRPWIRGSQHPYAKDWLRYKSRSPWKDVPLGEDKRSLHKKVYESFYRKMPLSFSVWLSGLLHSTLLPRIQRRSKR